MDGLLSIFRFVLGSAFMKSSGGGRWGLWVICTVMLGGGFAFAQATPATAPASVAATTTTSAPAKKPTVDELLANQSAVPFDFTNTPIGDIMDYIAKSYHVQIVNQYDLSDRLTMKQLGNLTPREAINILNASILALGYAVIESVRGEPPTVVLTIVPTKKDAGTLVSIYNGNDPAAIPEGEARRTQVMTCTLVDPEKARESILSVVGKQAEITVNASTKTIIITDTSSHVHTAAAVLQMLEKQAADKK
jgi:type II secretory pathway component GspD/PulD (secretin)